MESKPVDQDQIDIRLRALYGETLGRIDEKLKALDTKLDTVSKDVSVGNVSIKIITDDHEKRIRALEQKILVLFAIASTIGSILSLITPSIHVSIVPH